MERSDEGSMISYSPDDGIPRDALIGTSSPIKQFHSTGEEQQRCPVRLSVCPSFCLVVMVIYRLLWTKTWFGQTQAHTHTHKHPSRQAPWGSLAPSSSSSSSSAAAAETEQIPAGPERSIKTTPTTRKQRRPTEVGQQSSALLLLLLLLLSSLSQH